MHHTVHRFILLGMIALVVLWSSCKKEDDVSPVIMVEFPSDGANYQVLDTIRVGISVSDNERIETIRGWLTTLDGASASTVKTIDPSGSEYSGVIELIITDKYLPSGEYIIKLMASDGMNEEYAFIEINLTAFPKERRSIITVSESGIVERIDSSGNIIPVLGLSHDIGGLCVNNRDDQALVNGSIDGRISAINLDNNSIVWSKVHPDQPPAPAFLAQTCDNAQLLISGYDHIIYGHNSFGDLILNKMIGSSYRPEELTVNDGQLLVEQVQTGTSNRFMFHYNRSSLAFQNQLAIPINVEAICGFDSERIMLFGNDAGQAKVLRYDYQANSYWEPRMLESGALLDAVQGNGNHYFIAQSDGIYGYTFSPNFLSLIVPGVQATQLRFDQDRGVLLAAVGSSIREYTISGNLLVTHLLSAEVASFDVHYTK